MNNFKITHTLYIALFFLGCAILFIGGVIYKLLDKKERNSPNPAGSFSLHKNSACTYQPSKKVIETSLEDTGKILLKEKSCRDGLKKEEVVSKNRNITAQSRYMMKKRMSEQDPIYTLTYCPIVESIEKTRVSYSEKIENALRKVDITGVWSFIYHIDPAIHDKEAVLCYIRDNFSIYKDRISKLRFYYEGFIQDIIEYIRRNKPLMLTGKEGTAMSPGERRETFGDMYLRNSAECKGEELSTICFFFPEEGISSYLICALTMILPLPEIYEDFSSVSDSFISQFAGILQCDNDFMPEENFHILVLCHKLVAMNKILRENKEPQENSAKAKIAIRRYCAELELLFNKLIQYLITKEKETDLEICFFNLYRIFVKFYQYSPYFTADGYRIKGKGIFRSSIYKKYTICPMNRENNEEDSEELYNMRISSVLLKTQEKRDIVASISGICKEAYLHINYINNSAQVYEVVSIPYYTDKEPIGLFYTVEFVIRYLADLFDVDKKKIVALERCSSGLSWTAIYLDERRKSVVEKMVEYDLFFYYIEEDPEKTDLLMVEFLPEWVKDPSAYKKPLPLFVTRLMWSALEMIDCDTGISKMEKAYLIRNFHFRYKVPYRFILKGKHHQYHPTSLDYYSDMYAPSREALGKETIACYEMEPKKNLLPLLPELSWIVRVPHTEAAYLYHRFAIDQSNSFFLDGLCQNAVYCKEYFLNWISSERSRTNRGFLSEHAECFERIAILKEKSQCCSFSKIPGTHFWESIGETQNYAKYKTLGELELNHLKYFKLGVERVNRKTTSHMGIHNNILGVLLGVQVPDL